MTVRSNSLVVGKDRVISVLKEKVFLLDSSWCVEGMTSICYVDPKFRER